MKKYVLITAVVLFVPFVHAAISPLAGFYVSQELSDGGMPNDGIVMDGRWSESYPTGQEGEIGSTVSAASWDGAALGTMWEATGMAIDAAPNNYESGTNILGQSYEKWYTTYSGGTLTLKNSGPWWNSADAGTEYALTVDSYSADTTKTDLGGGLLSVRSEVVLDATFNDNPDATVEFIIATAILTGYGSTPAVNYPDFAIPSAPAGSWGNVQKIQMRVVPEPATLCLLGLGGLLLRRKK